MNRYLNPAVVRESFDRLASKTGEGKSHLERTSAILYFLAFDAACQSTEKVELDLDPERLEGKNNRKQLELEFTKLVLLDTENGQPIQFSEFGKIDTTNIAPEKRISANFLTVPLKKATTQSDPYHYPKRPNAPLLKLGHVATRKKWGMQIHEDFQKNFFIVISTAKSSTPAYDLAVLIFRDATFTKSNQDIYTGLCDLLDKKFTSAVALLLKKRIEKEKVLVRSKHSSFIDNYSNFIKFGKGQESPEETYEKMTKEELIEKIHELEAVLKSLQNH